MKIYSFSKNSDMKFYEKYYTENLSEKRYDNWIIITSHSIKSFLLLFVVFASRKKLLVFVHDQIPHPNYKLPIIYCLNILICIVATEIGIYSQPRGIFKYFKWKLNQVTLPSLLSEATDYRSLDKSSLEHLQTDTNFVLICGRYDRYKLNKGFVDNFDKIVKELNKNGTILIVVGSGWKKSPISYHEYIVDDYVSDEILYSYLQYCRQCLMPYSSATQSGFFSLLSFFGTPCYVSQIPGLIEQFCDAKFPVYFVDEWSDYIEQIKDLNS